VSPHVGHKAQCEHILLYNYTRHLKHDAPCARRCGLSHSLGASPGSKESATPGPGAPLLPLEVRLALETTR